MELLIQNGMLVTMDPKRSVVRADLLIDDGRIQRIAPRIAKGSKPRRVLDATDKLVLPGLIQAHTHLCQTLFRNRADGLELLEWLRQRIWPFEAAHDARSLRASADLGIAELLLGGTTAIQDMGTVHHTEVLFEAAKAAGLRFMGGKAMMDAGQGVPAGLRETTRASMDESIALAKAFNKPKEGLTGYAFAPRFVLSCTEELMKDVSKEARRLKARVHTHASENQTECQVVRDRVGSDNVEYFHKIGLSGEDVSLAHCVWLTAREQRVLVDTKTNVVHCPSSNLKLASGIARIPELLEAGVRVALGADGAPCSNNMDAFMEMRLAALLHLPRVGPLGMPPVKVLELATLGGARALGLEDQIGSLEEGKQADLIVIDLNAPHATPSGEDAMARIVYCARSSDVETVIVAGKVLVEHGELLDVDVKQLRATAEEQAQRLVTRSHVE